MTLDEIRQEWNRQAEKVHDEVMKKYHEQKIGSGGREGLGVYGIHQERIAKKKVQIAVKLLKQHQFETSMSNVHKITRQSRSTIQRYMPADTLQAQGHHRLDNLPDHQLAEVVRLRPIRDLSR